MQTETSDLQEISYSFSKWSQSELRRAVKRAEPSIFDDLIRYLENDPRDFGSGYIKEIIWNYIRRYELKPAHITRLEQAAVQYLHRPMSREFKFMCQTMARIATQDFWQLIYAYLHSDNPRIQLNSFCLSAYSQGVIPGEKQRLELNRFKLKYYRLFSPPPEYFTVARLLELILDPQNWREGQVLYREPDPDDLPILYYEPSQDHKIARLNVASSHTERLLEKLDLVLSTGSMDYLADRAWHYAIYLLRQIDDENAVDIVIRFLKNKISYKFDGPTKSGLLGTSLKVFRYYHTPEALITLEEYSEDEILYIKHYQDNRHGWILSYP